MGCHLYREFVLDNPDPDRLRQAWQDLVDHHDMLRAVIDEDGTQRVLPSPGDWDMPVHEAEQVGGIRSRLSDRRYVAGEWPMFDIEVSRVSAERAIVHLSLDTIITDAHGYALLLRQWCGRYHDPAFPLPLPEISARDCVQTITGRTQADRTADLDYWAGELAGLPLGPAVVGGVDSGTRRPLDATVSSEQWHKLRKIASELAVSPTALVLDLFTQCLTRMGARRPFSLVVTTSERPKLPRSADNLVGPFTSTAIHVTEQTDDMSFAESVQAAHAGLLEHLQHGSVSGIEAARRAKVTMPPVVFTSLLDIDVAGGFGGAIDYGVSQTSDVALDHQMWEQGGGLRLRWDVDDARFAAGDLDTAFAIFRNALASVDLSEGEAQPPHELSQAYMVARLSSADDVEGCQCYRGYEVEDLDFERLSRAVRWLVDGYDVLRARFTAEGVRVRDRGPAEWSIPVIDMDDHERLRARMTSVPVPLGQWPLIDVRVTRDATGLSTVHCAIDLLVGDAPTIHTLFRELWRRYDDENSLVRARKDVGKPNRRANTEYWHERLADIPSGPALPEPSADRDRFRLAGKLTGYRELARRAAAIGLSPDSVVLAAFTRALSEHFTRPYALPVVLWPPEEEGRRLGESSFMTWLAAAEGSLLAAAHDYQEHLDRDLQADSTGALSEMRRLILTSDKRYPIVYTGLVDLTDHPLPAGVSEGPWLTSTPDCALDCIGVVDGDELDYAWDFVAGDLAGQPVADLFAAFAQELEQFRDDAGKLTPEERQKILYTWNDTKSPIPDDGPVHLLFERAARNDPGSIALHWRGGSLSYGELNRQANRIAWRLLDHGVQPGDIVAVHVPRGPDMVAAVHGILKAGGAYLPVDPTLPPARVSAILGLADARIMLTTSAKPGKAPTVVEVDRDPLLLGEPRADENPPATSTQHDIAYVIFTSGSTGTPKGVAIAHRSVRNLIAFCATEFALEKDDIGLAVTSLGFDLSVFDLLGMLGHGAGVYIADEEQQRDPALLHEVLRSHPITLWNSAPTTLHQLTPLLERDHGDQAAANLRLVLLSGDFIPLSLPGNIRESFPNAATIALGGPTETTVWSNIFHVGTVDPDWRSIPYGKPIANTRHYVLDEGLRPCPVGVEGDLFTAGDCLAMGYYGRPDLTAERFVPDPFVDTGEQMFRTGDRAFWRADGNLIISGRADRQVKVRGHRVEPGEIEHCLRGHPSVQDVVVLARRDDSGDDRLVAYVVATAGAEPDSSELRAHAARELPPYLVPTFVAFVPSFPATANGKLDREALPWPIRPAVPPVVAEAPVPFVHEVAKIFADVLGTPSVEVAKDLWDQGATSFTMVQVSARLKRLCGQRVPVSALVSEPTVVAIARALGERTGNTPPQPKPSEPKSVDLFSSEEREAFKKQAWNLRARNPGATTVPLVDESILDPSFYDRRSSRRDFLPTPLGAECFSRLLSLLRKQERFAYPSAGDTYSVQVYLHLKPNAVEGIAEGIYYYRQAEHSLELVNDAPVIDRRAHFYYNRPVYDRSGIGIYLIGQRHGIVPIYQEVADRFLLLEAGYIGQLLMSRQSECGTGLCPVGTMTFDDIRDQFGLDDGHVYLHAFMAGPVERHAAKTTVARPPEVMREAAVIGVACRFPGAEDVGEFWQELKDGRCAVGTAPAERGLGAASGGFLDHVERFDSSHFKLSPAEAATLDPQLKALLAAVWTCIEDAGHTPASLVESAPRVGVFTATMWQDHQHVGADLWRAGGAASISALASDIPNRISNFFGFTGASVAVNTSCSSSLTALHSAMISLRQGDCDAAVVAAANLILHPYHLALLSSAGLLAEKAPVAAFDADASGWCPGEGAGAILIRPLEAARGERDPVRGIVESTWVGYPGGGRFGHPDPVALATSISTVISQAGVRPSDIGYVECAAAGAGVADAAEMAALADVFTGAPVLVGTVKPNIGHLEAASGLSQLVKVLLQLGNRQIAPTLTARDRSPLVDWADIPLEVVDELTGWVGPERALINALGATGSYAHVVVRSGD
ncbi:MAG: amino acid adenylation domain-containing protein [Umezawaea sp.]